MKTKKVKNIPYDLNNLPQPGDFVLFKLKESVGEYEAHVDYFFIVLEKEEIFGPNTEPCQELSKVYCVNLNITDSWNDLYFIGRGDLSYPAIKL